MNHSRFSGFNLGFLLCLLVPKAALVSWECAQIPRLDHKTLCVIDVVLVLQLLDPDLHPILCEYDVFRLHFVGGGMGDILDGKPDVVTNKGAYAQEDQKEDKRERFPERFVSMTFPG